MKRKLIKINSEGTHLFSDEEKRNGIEFVLIDSNDSPIASYSYYGEKIKNSIEVSYHSYASKIVFSIHPSIISEIVPLN